MTASPSTVAYRDPGAIFTTTADTYVRFRPEHPHVLIQHVAHSASACDSDAPILDLGCGPGVIARRLAEQGFNVIAVDPNQEMLAAGRKRSPHLDRIDWREGDSTTVLDLPQVRATVIGDAFHYMDRDQTLADLDRVVAPNGFVAVVVSHALDTPKAWWEPILDHIRDRMLSAHRAAGPDMSFQYLTEDHETVLRRSPFSRVRMLRVDHHLHLTLDELVGLQYTYAFSSPAVLGDARLEFETVVRNALTAVEPSGWFTATVQAAVIIGERP